jgi:hypothetical protein
MVVVQRSLFGTAVPGFEAVRCHSFERVRGLDEMTAKYTEFELLLVGKGFVLGVSSVNVAIPGLWE